MKIVSLLPNATEILFAIGYGEHLVGRSHECDYPSSVTKLPTCTQTKVPPRGPGKTIHKNVQNLVNHGLSVYEVDGEKLNQLQPDIIITQMQCELCAASPDDVVKAVNDFLDYQPKVVTLAPNFLQDVWEDFQKIGDALGDEEAVTKLQNRLKEEMQQIAQKAIEIPEKPKVAMIEWIDPLMLAGNWIPKLVEYVGARNLFIKEGEHSPIIDFSSLVEANPEKIIVAPCGFDMNQTREEMPSLENYAFWQDLEAVKNKKVYISDGHQYFNRSGPRLLDSLKILAEIIHPETFHFNLEGSGWKKWYRN